jgi:hypothetical protein
MHDFRVRCAIDLELPASDRYAELAADWLVRGAGELAGEFVTSIEAGPPLDPDSLRRNGPCGPPGSTWGFISVARPGARGERRTAKVLSTKNLAWLRSQLADPPTEATIGLSVLDSHGYPGESPLRGSVQRVIDAPDWISLSFAFDESRLAQPEFQRCLLTFVKSVADRVNPSFGQCEYDDALGRTALEQTLVPPRLPGDTVANSRHVLRGYSWLTVCPQELAGQLGGVDTMRAAGAFREVEPLQAGGLWLVATADYRDYDQPAVERVFEAVAPVLPPGVPRRFDEVGFPPDRVAVRDAASVRQQGGA